MADIGVSGSNENRRSREAIFERLVSENGPHVARYIQRRRYPIVAADVSDLVEEVFIVVWRRLDSVPDEATLPWMLGIARNVLSTAKRSERRRSDRESNAWNATIDPSAEDEIVASESIRTALAQLKPRERDILILHYWDGLSAEDIGTAMSLSSHSAAVRLSRAGQRFQEILSNLEN